jgi:hypothetical protein
MFSNRAARHSPPNARCAGADVSSASRASVSSIFWADTRASPPGAMATERYTDGTDGKGIRDFDELLRYFQRCPLQFYSKDFVLSYDFLMTSPEREARLLAVYDRDGSSAETLRDFKDISRREGWPAVEVCNKVVRYKLRQAFFRHLHPLAPPASAREHAQVASLAVLLIDASASGRAYTLCEPCSAAESAGHATEPMCSSCAATQIEPGGGWADSNRELVSCGLAQCLRGRKANTSSHLKQKLASFQAALKASPEERRRIRASGHACGNASCARRELYAGAFKTCSRCRSAHYCSALCQVRRRLRRYGTADETYCDIPPPCAEDALEAAQGHLRGGGDQLTPCAWTLRVKPTKQPRTTRELRES